MADIPRHVAIILDGNGRWAKAHGKPRTYGHTMGARNVEPVCRAAYERGIEYLTMYAFSTENWSRPSDEVAALMRLLKGYMKNCLTLAKNNNMRVRVIGDKSGLAEDIQRSIATLEEASAGYTGLTLCIAINYGGRDELVRGMRRMLRDHDAGRLDAEALTEEGFAAYLDTAGIPDPDLLIRTSGEQRLSNYLLWQLAYAEFYFTPTPWPDFDAAQLDLALAAYADRDRRYGKV